MVTTNNAEWAARIRMMSLHGLSRDAWNRYSAEGSWYYEILSPGFKYNLTDIAAALGLAQLKSAIDSGRHASGAPLSITRAFEICRKLFVRKRRPTCNMPGTFTSFNWTWIVYASLATSLSVNCSKPVLGAVCISFPYIFILITATCGATDQTIFRFPIWFFSAFFHCRCIPR